LFRCNFRSILFHLVSDIPISCLCVLYDSVDIDSPFVNSDGLKEPGSAKRGRSESCSRPASKACREKMRREKLNDRFMELSSLLDPGNPPKTDKAAILSDAARLVTQLRNDAQKLKDSNESLQEKIKELKASFPFMLCLCHICVCLCCQYLFLSSFLYDFEIKILFKLFRIY
ncbi:hypothetical protein B296_00041483, partial [Ensete ventricosum]